MKGSRSVVLNVILVLAGFSTLWTVSTKKKVQTMQIYWLDCSMPQDKICDPLSCKLKVVKRGVSIMNLNCGLVKTLDNIHLTMKVYQKSASSLRYILDRTEDVCLFFSKRKGSILNLLEPYIRKYSNIKLKCPAMPELLRVTNLTAEASDLPSYFPEGNFRVDLRLLANKTTPVLNLSLKVKIGHTFVDDRK